jgi:hypothetical protein
MKALLGPTSGRPVARSASHVRPSPGSSGSLDALGGFWLPALSAVLALVVATVFGGPGQALLVLSVFFLGVGALVVLISWTSRRSQREIEAGLRAARQRQLLAWIESLASEPREVTVTATIVEPEPLELSPVRSDDPTIVFGVVVESHEVA